MWKRTLGNGSFVVLLGCLGAALVLGLGVPSAMAGDCVPPPPPVNPAPEDGHTDVPIDTSLFWNGIYAPYAARTDEERQAIVDWNRANEFVQSGLPTVGRYPAEAFVTYGAASVEILVFNGYSDNSDGGEFENTLNAIADHFTDFNATPTATEDPTVLAIELVGKDVFLVPEQENGESTYLQSMGSAWAPVLQSFVQGGGTVIFCEEWGPSLGFVSATGLMDLEFVDQFISDPLDVVTPDHPITAGLPATITATDATGRYNIYDADAVTLVAWDTYPVVAVREVGAGHVVLVGFDYYSYNAETALIMANAVQLTATGCTTRYDVYLGTDPGDLNLVCDGVTAPMCDPGLLDECATYHWQVCASNAAGEACGDVWSFTTVGCCDVPDEPYGPLPADGALDVPVDTELVWNHDDPGDCRILDDFEDGDIAEYTFVSGGAYFVAEEAAHDGVYGLAADAGAQDQWLYRNDAAAAVGPGDTISYWVKLRATTDPGRAYCGFGATETGTYALTLCPNTDELFLYRVDNYGTYVSLAVVPQTWTVDRWYRAEVEWEVDGTIVGRLYDSDGMTMLNTLTGFDSTITSGGIALRAFEYNDATPAYSHFDTIEICPTNAPTAREAMPVGQYRPAPGASTRPQSEKWDPNTAQATARWSASGERWRNERTRREAIPTGATSNKWRPNLVDHAPTAGPAMTTTRRGMGEMVAIFQDTAPWGYASNQDVLTQNGITFVMYGSADIGVVDLSSFDKVIIASDQDMAFYSALVDNRAWLEAYATAGGAVDLHLARASQAALNGIVMPGGFVAQESTSEFVSIADPYHPLVNTPNAITDEALDDWNSSTHGYFAAYPLGAEEILEVTDTGEPCAMDVAYGAGRIVATIQPVEWGHASMAYLENMILYGLDGGDDCLVTFDVYLGTHADAMSMVCNGVEDAVCDPGLLASGTSYVWQVCATNPAGETCSDVWAFETGGTPAHLVDATPAMDHSLWRAAGNVLTLEFNQPVSTPTCGELMIQRLLPGGQFGPLMCADFDFEVMGSTLTITEVVPSMSHNAWYAVRTTGDWPGVVDFEMHYLCLVGDANDDGRVLPNDLSLINTDVPNLNAPSDWRLDINGDGLVLPNDLSMTNHYVPTFGAPKPSGH